MCQDKEHGGRRCEDNSDARRRRRKAKQSLEENKVIVVPEGKLVQPHEKPLTMDEISKEAKNIASLLYEPVDPDDKVQAEKDAVLEQHITRLGLAIGAEADRRSGFNEEEYRKELERSPGAPDSLRKQCLAMETEAVSFGERLAEKVKEYPNAVMGKVIQGQYQMWKDLAEKVDKIREEIETLDTLRKNVHDSHLVKLTEAYRSVIADIRPVGGTIEYYKLSNPRAAQLFQDTVGKYYPSEWIKRSNEDGPVSLNLTRRQAGNNVERAGYTSETIFMNATEDIETKAIKVNYSISIDKVDDYVETMSSDDDPVKKVGEVYQVGEEKFQAIEISKRIAFDSSQDTPGIDGVDGRPEGEGWKYGYVPLEGDSVQVPPRKQWYKQEVLQGAIIPAIVTHGRWHPGSESTAYHEFVHRVEATSPNDLSIVRMEKAFLKRRCADDQGNMPSLVHIWTSQSTPHTFDTEVMYPNDFMQSYIGRYYQTDKTTEVLSMGSEATFGKNYGGFLGIGDDVKKDLDHRGFTLGIFATA